MARFDVFLVDGVHCLDVQTSLLPSMGTRLVVPLLPQDKVPKPLRKLHPVVAVSDQNLVMATHLMLAVPEGSLGRPLASLFPRYDEIVAAIDMVFNGF